MLPGSRRKYLAKLENRLVRAQITNSVGNVEDKSKVQDGEEVPQIENEKPARTKIPQAPKAWKIEKVKFEDRKRLKFG